MAMLMTTGSAMAQTAQDFTAILANPDRPSEERTLDAARKPDEVLKFYGVKAGDEERYLTAAAGYYTAILAKVVGPKGAGLLSNPTARPELAERWKNPAFANIKAIDGPLGTGFPPAAGSITRFRDHPPQLSRPCSGRAHRNEQKNARRPQARRGLRRRGPFGQGWHRQRSGENVRGDR